MCNKEREAVHTRLTGVKGTVITFIAVDTATAAVVQTRRVDCTARPWPLTVEPYVNYSAH